MAQQFDLFVVNGAAPAKADGSSATKRHSSTALSEDDMVRQLQIETGRYRILKKLEPRSIASRPHDPRFPLKRRHP